MINYLIIMIMFCTTLLANPDAIVKYGTIEESTIQIVMFIIGTFFIFINYLVLMMAKKYKISFLSSYILSVVKKVELQSKDIAKDWIYEKYQDLYTKNPKLAYAKTIIERDYSGVINKYVGILIGVFDKKIDTIIESSVHDIKLKK